MAKITDLTAITTGNMASGDTLVIVDIDVGATKKVTAAVFAEAIASTYMLTLFDDTTAAAARSTLGIGAMSMMEREAHSNLTHLLYPSMVGGYGELYRNGWESVGFNQQWGGPWGGDYPTGNGSQAWFPTGYIDNDWVATLGNGAAATWTAMAFKVPETITADAVWLKLCKIGDPQKDNEPIAIYITDGLSTGDPTGDVITNGTMDTMDGPGFAGALMASASEPWPIVVGSSAVDTVWYRFTDATGVFSLTANTQYYIVIKAAGADAANYYRWARKNTAAHYYPCGNLWQGDDADPANWTEDTSSAVCFLIESSSGTALLQSGGSFDGMLEFGEGTPTNESRAIVRPLKDFWNDEEFTLRFVCGPLTASKTLLDANMGLLHKNRIRVYTDNTPNLCVAIYESDGSTHTIVDGATDVSAAGTYDVMLHVRSKNDGSDVVDLLINNSTEGTQLSSLSISFDNLMVEIGHLNLGGGFPAAPTWTKDFKTNELASGNKPSNDANTAVVVGNNATEANTFTIIAADDTLHMNYATTQSANDLAYYTCDPTYVSATGGVAAWLIHPSMVIRTAGERGLEMNLNDGAFLARLLVHEYYLEFRVGAGGANTFYVHHDFLTRPTLVEIKSKGSNTYLYVNGRLAVDATGLNAWADVDTFCNFGDPDGTATVGADCILMEWLAYVSGPLYFEVNGCQLHEFAYWWGDMTGLSEDLYNSGTELSVKEVCGIPINFINPPVQTEGVWGITGSKTTTATAAVLCDDMGLFALFPGFQMSTMDFSLTVNNDTATKTVMATIGIDGTVLSSDINRQESTEAADWGTTGNTRYEKLTAGLHKIEGMWRVSGNTGTTPDFGRKVIVEVR